MRRRTYLSVKDVEHLYKKIQALVGNDYKIDITASSFWTRFRWIIKLRDSEFATYPMPEGGKRSRKYSLPPRDKPAFYDVVFHIRRMDEEPAP
jgi:hypothetical protein